MAAARRVISLDQVRVGTACPAGWDNLSGDGPARFCGHCNKHVHNLSAMTADAAQRLVCESAGSLCIAYVPTAAGAVRTLEYRAAPKPRFAWKLVAALGGLGAVGATVVSAFVHRAKPPVTPPMIMGDMVAAPPPMVLGKIGVAAPTPVPQPECPASGEAP
jgi:hypothetical protein